MRRAGRCWGRSFSPCAAWTRVDPRAVQQVVRTWFARWGLPEAVRVDNGAPWGGWNDLPPDLALWLLGLGVDVVWNRPGHKQGNAVIERGHGVCRRWVEPATCPDPATLQARLDYFTTLPRERYPARGGRSRLAAFPTLAAGGRPYDPAREGRQWDARRVWRWLGQHSQRRRVDKAGRISLANRALGVGKAWARQEVTVRLEVRAGTPGWTIRAPDGAVLRHHPAPELSRARIRALAVSHRRAQGKPCRHLGG